MDPLAGVRVVVTRSGSQAPALVKPLRALGAEVVEVPTIEIVEAADGGAALRSAVLGIDRYDWVVVTSPIAATRFCSAFRGEAGGADEPCPVGGEEGDVSGRARRIERQGFSTAAVGPATAEVLEANGLAVTLVPSRYVSEGLLGEFPSPEHGCGRVLVVRGALGRDLLPDGLRSLGWTVDVVETHQTLPVPLSAEQVDKVAGAQVVTFTSPSTVDALLAAVGLDGLPPVVACIGPVTAAAAVAHGIAVSVVATPHSIEGLLSSLVTLMK